MPALRMLSLKSYSLPAGVASGFIHLQELTLTHGMDAICNLTSCTQLTKLHMRYIGDALKQLDLPHGDDVQLQDLLVDGNWRQCDDFVMHHLEDARCLTALVLNSAYPSNFREAGWPAEMPSLRHVQIIHTSHQLPQEWAAISVALRV